MSNIGNKEILSRNLRRYIERSGKDRRELAEIWGFPYSTVTEWVNGRKYPRIDRIEVMADYFGILKSDLIEDKTEATWKKQHINDVVSTLTVRMKTDKDFFSVVEGLNKLDAAQLASVKTLVETFLLK